MVLLLMFFNIMVCVVVFDATKMGKNGYG